MPQILGWELAVPLDEAVEHLDPEFEEARFDINGLELIGQLGRMRTTRRQRDLLGYIKIWPDGGS